MMVCSLPDLARSQLGQPNLSGDREDLTGHEPLSGVAWATGGLG